MIGVTQENQLKPKLTQDGGVRAEGWKPLCCCQKARHRPFYFRPTLHARLTLQVFSSDSLSQLLTGLLYSAISNMTTQLIII